MNLHCFENNWEFRLRHILDYVIAVKPDVIAFQEVCTEQKGKRSQINFIFDYLTARNFPIQSFEPQYTHPAWDRYDEYLLSVSKHQASAVTKGLLPKSLLQRGFVGLQIHGRWYVNSHLEYKRENADSRREQIEHLQQRFSHSPLILMGDFNSAPDSIEQAPLWEAGFTPVFPGDTFVGRDDNGKSNIDGFWISPLYRERLSSHSGKVVLNEKVNDQHLSDHFGVLLQVALREWN